MPTRRISRRRAPFLVPAYCAVNPTHPVVCFGGVLLGCVFIVVQHLYYNLTLCFHVGVGGGAKRGF